jgi:bud site selection protein 31
MPRVRTSRSTPPPAGFDEIEPILGEYERKMRQAEAGDAQRKVETLWPVMQLTHARSRYIYDLYYKRDAISRALYDWLLKYHYADSKYVPRPHPYSHN